MGMRDYTKRDCEAIDVAIFSGDQFMNPCAVQELEEYLKRWQRELNNLRDISEEPLFHETYKTAAVSTGELTLGDYERITFLGQSEACGMIMDRDTGSFIKLYEEKEHNRYEGMSERFHAILDAALAEGFRMVEFDCDAPELENFKF